MKQAILLHGTGGNDKDYFWFENAKKLLEENDYAIWWPQLPSPDRPTLDEAVDYVQENMPELDENSVIIGHSSACPLILSLFQRSDLHVRLAILVSGYYTAIQDKVSDLMIEKDGYDWEKVKSSADEIVLINSDNDPWGCDDVQARPVADNLGAKFILAKQQGHMGSESFDQPYRTNKFVEEILKSIF
jgi:hypothetical protein